MIELNEANAAEYLRSTGRLPRGDGAVRGAEILVQSLSGGIANVVLRVLDTAGGDAMGTDARSPEDMRQGADDQRPRSGRCLVLKQPLAKFRTAAEWRVDVDRVLVERDCMALLAQRLPAGSVPQVLWFDEPNNVLAMSCAPAGAVIWKKALLAGEVSLDAATHAGMLLAMLHSSTAGDSAVESRFGDRRLFFQQRIDPYLHATAAKHPALQNLLRDLAAMLEAPGRCLVHGDFSPKNIFLIAPQSHALAGGPHTGAGERNAPIGVERLLLLDFEVAYYGHPAFDVATLLNHFLLKGFYHQGRTQGTSWRAFMQLADHFWETYRYTADPDLVRAASARGGQLLGALLLARVDGKSPAEYLDAAMQANVRRAALALLALRDHSIDAAMDAVALSFDPPRPAP